MAGSPWSVLSWACGRRWRPRTGPWPTKATRTACCEAAPECLTPRRIRDGRPRRTWRTTTPINNAVAKAKQDAQSTQLSNQILLAMAKFGPPQVLKDVWDKVVREDDHLLRMFTPQWPDVAPG